MKKTHFNFIQGKTTKMYEKPLKLYHLFLKSGEIKKRSHSYAVTDWIYRGFQAVNPVSYCMGVTSYFSTTLLEFKLIFH